MLINGARRHPRPYAGISIIVPFTNRGGRRAENWYWLRDHYLNHMPGVELIEAAVDDIPFNKSKAVNDGYRQSRGDIIVIMDADCLINPYTILDAALDIRHARMGGRRLWLMPYRHLYRLTDDCSRAILDHQNPADEIWPDDDLDACLHENHGGSMWGHMFGALIQVMPREAFECVGGMDERFAGWGGEDISFARALDTLYGRHKSLDRPVHHLWHEMLPGKTRWTSREWVGQSGNNENLALLYAAAFGDAGSMRELVAAGWRHAHPEEG